MSAAGAAMGDGRHRDLCCSRPRTRWTRARTGLQVKYIRSETLSVAQRVSLFMKKTNNTKPTHERRWTSGGKCTSRRRRWLTRMTPVSVTQCTMSSQKSGWTPGRSGQRGDMFNAKGICELFIQATRLPSTSLSPSLANSLSSGAMMRPMSAMRDQSSGVASDSFFASWRVASRKARRFSAAAV